MLDAYCGCGTTVAVAQRVGRRWIGIDEIAAAGKFRHPLLNREDDRLQVITVAELFDSRERPGVRLDLPMARSDAVKSAAAKGDADKQINLL